tara:strand:- start:401 stop:1156 length:756 start_codon:yes stop_codon:yes gene_type:complete
MDLNVIDLFSGIGGFSLGLQKADPRFKTVAFCEIDPFCKKVLQKNFPEVKIYDDIKKTNFTETADIVVGGFPCQSISIAGKKKGKDDGRWLFPEMFRIIKQTKPRWIIAENVQNLINIADGEILRGIYNDLETENYEVQTFRISAASQGAWHRRERVWIVANSDVWNTESTRRESSINGSRENEFRRTNTWEIQCQEEWWKIESKLFGVPHGISTELDKDRSNRIKALGNAIVPQIITEIGKAIIEVEENG